ncbi:hypothetical protein [Sphingomonas lacusdianchii]|uniref:hypothetical protein n=1 Tax=Sphingomonas lacusdianchii TaxID=2917992 RepID=UPI001F56FC11|nr:hypothetical protein [Sphingomonas sp. JXJ CY 53]
MSPVERFPDLGPWAGVLADAASADTNLSQYLLTKVNRSALWLAFLSATGLVAVIYIWFVDTRTAGISSCIGSASSILGILHGYNGVKRSHLAGKIAGHIQREGSSVKLVRRYRLMHQVFLVSCFGLLTGFTSRIIGLVF